MQHAALARHLLGRGAELARRAHLFAGGAAPTRSFIHRVEFRALAWEVAALPLALSGLLVLFVDDGADDSRNLQELGLRKLLQDGVQFTLLNQVRKLEIVLSTRLEASRRVTRMLLERLGPAGHSGGGLVLAPLLHLVGEGHAHRHVKCSTGL